MIYITQLIYLHPGQEADFNSFESVAIPLISKYGGELLLRIKTDEIEYFEGSLEKPYEIHIVSLPHEQALKDFSTDPERQRVLHLKNNSVRATILYKGEMM